MTKIDERDCLERAVYCAELARGESDPRLRAFLECLARDWEKASKDAPVLDGSANSYHGA